MRRGWVFVAGLCAWCAMAVTVREMPREAVYRRGDVNVKLTQPIDTAAWIWAPGHVRWGVETDIDSWNVSFGEKGFPSDFFRFRCRFTADGSPLRFDVSADERYVLYLDGRAVARGPVRGMVEHWYYHTYEVKDLAPGEHVLEAVVWQLGVNAPIAQLSYRGGFILKAEGGYDGQLTTGKAKWRVARLVNTVMTDRGTSVAFGAGSQSRATGCGFGDEVPAAAEWKDAVVARAAVNVNEFGGRTKGWMLYPADRPEMRYEVKTPGRIRAVRKVADDVLPFTEADTASPEVGEFNRLLRGEKTVVPANTTLEIAWDLENYFCAYPELEVSGGRGASVFWGWTESSRKGTNPIPAHNAKDNRNEIVGKRISQTLGDEFMCDGRAGARFSAPWWRCGRWCRLIVRTAAEPLVVERVAIGETGYPIRYDAEFACDDPDLERIAAISRRTLESCVHEMTFDCPYYEQQMYPGDTRVQLEVLNAMTRDGRMARFAMGIFDYDRRDSGMVAMNFPTRGTQESATYTMCWLMMFKDYLLWHDDAAFLRLRMPGANASLMGLGLYENADGLLENLPGWSFMDWVRGDQAFKVGVAPDGEKGVSALNNLQYLLAVQSVAAVEEALGDKSLAGHWNAKAAKLTAAIKAKFMSAKGILADDLAHSRFSEHAQAMAILAGILDDVERGKAVAALEKGEGLAAASSYFAYYLFRAFAECGRADLVVKRLDVWRNYLKWGCRTTPETQYSYARSDCHAWSACPLYAFQTLFAGVTPASPFFKTVRVAPQPAGLKHIRAKTPCPQGVIETDFIFKDGKVSGSVTLPEGMSGVFEYAGRSQPLIPGANVLR